MQGGGVGYGGLAATCSCEWAGCWENVRIPPLRALLGIEGGETLCEFFFCPLS
jgi:hypothetical protein